MKKMIALLMALLLWLTPVVGSAEGNATYDYLFYLLEQGEYDMAIHVIEGLRDGKMDGPQQRDQPPQQSGQPPQHFDQVVEQPPISTGADWIFHMDLINQSDATLTLETLLIRDFMDEQELGTYGFEGSDLDRLPVGRLVLQPGDGMSWDDAHPVTGDFNRREYLHVFRSEQGELYRMNFAFDMRGMPTEAVAQEQWLFPVVLMNTSDVAWELTAMDITDLMDGEARGTAIFMGADLDAIGLGGIVLEPGRQMNWTDGHPATNEWNAREYRFHFVDANQQPQTLSFHFEELDKQNQPVDYSQDPGQDLKTLRHDAAFAVEVYDGVYWVPAAELGASRYSNEEIHRLLGAPPQEKQQAVATLYEALQLYQVGNFTPSDDNVRIFEHNVNWEHHKPGYHAVRTNTGCCATDSNWLRYILDGDYEEVGYIATSQRDGSGHIYNYLLHNGWYYIIDLTHYHASGNVMMTAVENGDLGSYYATDYILGNLHRVRDLQDYVNYVQQHFGDPPGLMFQYTAENCLAVDGARSANGVQIIYEDAPEVSVSVIFDDPADQLTFVRVQPPQMLPDWHQLP